MDAQSINIDFSQLRALTGEDNDFMVEILQLIIEQSPVVVDEMFESYERGDLPSLGATAHKYKSSINILGNPELSALVKEIEQTAVDQRETTVLTTLLYRFQNICRDLLEQLTSEIDELKATS
jgi:HPt (histidine-containing phosphotransfer) domain-containing protein